MSESDEPTEEKPAGIAGGRLNKRRSDRTAHERIDDLEDDISKLRERMAGMEAAMKSLGRSIDLLRVDVTAFKDQLASDIRGLRDGILSTFSRMFISLVFVLLVAFGAVASIVGGSVYLEGFGMKGGTHATPVPVAPQP